MAAAGRARAGRAGPRSSRCRASSSGARVVDALRRRRPSASWSSPHGLAGRLRQRPGRRGRRSAPATTCPGRSSCTRPSPTPTRTTRPAPRRAGPARRDQPDAAARARSAAPGLGRGRGRAGRSTGSGCSDRVVRPGACPTPTATACYALRRRPRLPEPVRGLRRAGARGHGRRAARDRRRRRPRCRRSVGDAGRPARRSRRRRRLGRGRSAACSTTPTDRARLIAAGPGPGRRAHRRAVGTGAWSAPTVSPSHEARRPLPPLRPRPRADRRGHDAHRPRAGRARATSCTSSPRCRGTSTTRSSRLGGPARAPRDAPSGARSPGSTRSRPTSESIPRRAVAFGGFSALAGLAGLRGGRVDGVLAMSPPLTLGLDRLGHGRRPPVPAGVQHPGRVPRRRRRARGHHRPARDPRRPLARARRATDRADAVTVLSDDLRDNVAAKLPAAEHRGKVRVIPNFVDTDAIRPLRPGDGLPPRARHRRARPS